MKLQHKVKDKQINIELMQLLIIIKNINYLF